jgi:hypothetical protein
MQSSLGVRSWAEMLVLLAGTVRRVCRRQERDTTNVRLFIGKPLTVD